jgi:hypothetical protein
MLKKTTCLIVEGALSTDMSRQMNEADVPLKGWLREHRGEDYLKALG